jgi:hypothetical protein
MGTENNQQILDWIESLGGGYVWEEEIFSIILNGYALSAEEAQKLSELMSVKQIALLEAKTEVRCLCPLTNNKSLRSLVLSRSLYSQEEERQLRSFCSNIELQWDE